MKPSTLIRLCIVILIGVLATSWSVYAQISPFGPPRITPVQNVPNQASKPPRPERAETAQPKSNAGEAAKALAEPPQRAPQIPRQGNPNSDFRRDEFPALPPDPYAGDKTKLPPLDEEMVLHGGSYLYQPEGDRLNWPSKDEAHYDLLRVPENWQKPKPPLTGFAQFLGNDPILPNPALKWLGLDGYAWEPRFVTHGQYRLFAFALEENNQRQDVIGHQLLLDLDLRLTGTERFHMQFRPLGRDNRGGSYYQFSNPAGYVDNSHGAPDRYWFEFELHSVLGAFVDPNWALDYQVTAGRIPLSLHNDLLINDEFHGVAVNKNNLNVWNFSNLNVQAYYGFNDVSAYDNGDADVAGVNFFVDYRRIFYEASYAHVNHGFDSSRDAHYLALSRTQLIANYSLATRALFKQGDAGGRGSGQLFTIEGNTTRVYDHSPLGIEKAVFFANAFGSLSGWNSIAQGNFNRLRTAFEVNPLVRIAAGPGSDDNWGIALGAQLFRHHDDESWVPEFAFEQPGGEAVWGVGLRYLRKVSCRSFLEVLGVYNESDDDRFDRLGVFGSYSILF